MPSWKKPNNKEFKDAQKFAAQVALAIVENGAYESMKPEDVAQYAIDLAEYVYSVDIDGSGD